MTKVYIAVGLALCAAIYFAAQQGDAMREERLQRMEQFKAECVKNGNTLIITYDGKASCEINGKKS